MAVTAIPTLADTVWRVVDHPITSYATLTVEEVGRRITMAASRRGWSLTIDGPQSLKARIATGRGGAELTVMVTWTERAYSIELLESRGFNQRGDQINGRANRWIRNLEQDISNIMSRT